MNTPVGVFRSPTGSFRAVLLLGLLLGAVGVGAVVALVATILVPFASACIQACAQNPMLMALARGSASLCVAVVGSGLLAGSVALVSQLRATRRLVSLVESRAAAAPRRLARLASELNVDGRLTYVSDPAAYAFCYGFLSPRVCISSGMARSLSNRELRAVLLHEQFHMRRRDPLKVLASRVLAGALFLLPVAAELRDRYLVEKELAADTHVIGQMSSQPLASALLKICRSSSRRPVAALATAAVGHFNLIGERVRHLSRPSDRPIPLRGSRIAASLAVVVLLLATTVGSAFAAERGRPLGGACCASGTSVCDLADESRVGQW